MRQSVEGCGELGVEFLTLYAFSQENWQRPKIGSQRPDDLLQKFLKDTTPELMERNVRLQAIGRIDRAARRVPAASSHASIEQTAANTGPDARSWRSATAARTEMIDAIKSIVREVERGQHRRGHDRPRTLQPAPLHALLIPTRTCSSAPPARCGLSNFLLWQLSYTEIYFTQTLWPDFRKEDLLEAVHDYSNRQRRYGSL